MEKLFEIKEEQDLDVFYLKGEMSFERMKYVWKAIFYEIILKSPSAILIKDDTLKSITYSNIIDILMWFFEIHFPRNIKIGIIVSNDPLELYPFAEMIASVKGWRYIKVFPNEKIARLWLSEPVYD
jgi:hypothetical protein